MEPFVGGIERCGSELKMVNDHVLPLCLSDLMWEFSLPVDRVAIMSIAIRRL